MNMRGKALGLIISIQTSMEEAELPQIHCSKSTDLKYSWMVRKQMLPFLDKTILLMLMVMLSLVLQISVWNILVLKNQCMHILLQMIHGHLTNQSKMAQL